MTFPHVKTKRHKPDPEWRRTVWHSFWSEANLSWKSAVMYYSDNIKRALTFMKFKFISPSMGPTSVSASNYVVSDVLIAQEWIHSHTRLNEKFHTPEMPLQCHRNQPPKAMQRGEEEKGRSHDGRGAGRTSTDSHSGLQFHCLRCTPGRELISRLTD
jgi:hypothetical protein